MIIMVRIKPQIHDGPISINMDCIFPNIHWKYIPGKAPVSTTITTLLEHVILEFRGNPREQARDWSVRSRGQCRALLLVVSAKPTQNGINYISIWLPSETISSHGPLKSTVFWTRSCLKCRIQHHGVQNWMPGDPNGGLEKSLGCLRLPQQVSLCSLLLVETGRDDKPINIHIVMWFRLLVRMSSTKPLNFLCLDS